jgi:hypothetical protein
MAARSSQDGARKTDDDRTQFHAAWRERIGPDLTANGCPQAERSEGVLLVEVGSGVACWAYRQHSLSCRVREQRSHAVVTKLSESEATVRVLFHPNWFNGWFFRLLAKPYALVAGNEHECDWKSPADFTVDTGNLRVTVYVRYRGTHSNLGTGIFDGNISAGETLSLIARNGVINQTPFHLSPLTK